MRKLRHNIVRSIIVALLSPHRFWARINSIMLANDLISIEMRWNEVNVTYVSMGEGVCSRPIPVGGKAERPRLSFAKITQVWESVAVSSACLKTEDLPICGQDSLGLSWKQNISASRTIPSCPAHRAGADGR